MEPLKLDFEGRTWIFDLTAVSASEWKHVRQYTGKNPFAVIEGIADSVIEDAEALVWLVKRQAQVPNLGEIGSDPNFNVLGFVLGWRKADKELGDKAQKEHEESGPKAPLPPSSTGDSLSG